MKPLGWRSIGLVGLAVALQGCAHGPAPLYAWGKFPHQQYDSLRGDGQSPAEQIQELEQQQLTVQSDHQALPPGFRAHLGLLYLDAGNPDKARELWLAEKAAFPESSPYMDQLLRRLEAPARTAQAGGQQ
jgi:hypothetical protein